MSKPIIHARSSAKKWGGHPEDYLEIHDLMDSSKSVFPDNRHRALTHNSWFFFIVERIYGHEIEVQTDAGIKKVSVRDICEQHVLEDFGMKFIPSPADYLENMDFVDWMNNGSKGEPTSHKKIANKTKNATYDSVPDYRKGFTID